MKLGHDQNYNVQIKLFFVDKPIKNNSISLLPWKKLSEARYQINLQPENRMPVIIQISNCLELENETELNFPSIKIHFYE